MKFDPNFSIYIQLNAHETHVESCKFKLAYFFLWSKYAFGLGIL